MLPSFASGWRGVLRRASVAASLAIAFHGSPAIAQDRWFQFYKGTALNLLVDTTTAVDRGGNNYVVWLKYAYNKPQPVSGNAGSMFVEVKERLLIDCNERRYKSLRLAAYDKAGTAIQSFDNEEALVQWQTPIPETVGEAVTRLCDHKGVIDGTYDAALRAYAESLTRMNEARSEGCEKTTDSRIKEACRLWYAYHSTPTEKIPAKTLRAWFKADSLLDATLSLEYPHWPVPP